MNPAKFATRQPVLVNMLVLLVLIAGGLTFMGMTKEEWPDIGATHALVTVSYPGASPLEVEKLVTIPIEERIETVQEIKTVQSTSAEGVCRIFVEFDPGISDYDLRLQELQREVAATPDLPGDADDPVVTTFRFGNSRLVSVGVRGDAPERAMQAAVERLEDRLRRVDGVERLEIAGKREREVWVEIDPHLLHSYGLSLQDIIGALERANQNVAGGTVESGAQEYLVRTVGEAATVSELRELIVKRGPASERVFLGDVATLSDTLEEPTSFGRINGATAVSFTVHKIVGGDTIRTVAKVQRVLEEEAAALPPGLELVTFDNTATEIRARLSGLYQNGALGLVLVLVCLYAFVGHRAALMTALGIPFSLLLAFIAMTLIGITINTITLFSLIITLGLIVDDAIVITENVYRYYEQGDSRYAAVVHGVQEVLWPVIAAVLTTIAAFLPMMMMSGWLGRYMAFIPMTVILALVASLAECLFVLPSHLFDFPPRYTQQPHPEAHHRARRQWLRSLTALYAGVLRRCIQRRYATLAGVLCSGAVALWLARNYTDIILFGGRDAPRVEVQFEVRDGTRIQETLKAATIMEAAALAMPRDVAEWVFTRVGTKGWRANRVTVSNAARVELDLVHHNDRDITSKQIVHQLREVGANHPVLQNVILHEEFEGPHSGDAVELDISGPNFATLRELSGAVREYLGGIEGVYDVRDNYLGGKEEVQIIVDEERAKLAGLDLRTIAQTARAALHGVEATTFYEEDEDVPVRVRYHTAARTDFTDLAWLEVVNPQGARVPFSNVARTERRPGMARIFRYDGERTITVYANVDEDVTTSLKVNTLLQEEFNRRLAAYPGYALHFGGENEETNQSVASLFRAFSVGILLIYMILGTQFKSFLQPVIVMAAVPFSFIGVVVGFLILDEPLGMMSLIGIVALSGIVVNDSLILVDFINRNRAGGMAKRESIIRSGMVRLRPILLTSITTIAGVMPIALGLFGTDDFLRPMAIAIGCGLTFATVLTLLIVPTFYAIVVDDILPRLQRLWPASPADARAPAAIDP